MTSKSVEWIVDVCTSYIVKAKSRKEARRKARSDFIEGYEPTEDRIKVRGRL